MIDSHCHLDHDPLFSNLKQVIINSKREGIDKILTICTTVKSFKNIIKIIKVDNMIYGTFGIHPHETSNNILESSEIKKSVNDNEKIIGVGETGLDFYYNNSDKDSQITSFKNHIEAAIDLEIPLIVHSRSAENDTYNILKKYYQKKKLKILMHCFTGSKDFAHKMLSLDAMFSASGIITFKNSLDLQMTFKEIPLDKLLIETDSPFLAPVPMRGKKNEPSFIKYTLKKLSELKNIDEKKLDKITTDNFNNLFFN
jgi:TatD DNase family protein